MVDTKVLHSRWLGKVKYQDALAVQKAITKGTANYLLLLEHDNVYTIGKSGTSEDILIDKQKAKMLGIGIEYADRGGKVTYHGPGQLVGYPIVTLEPCSDSRPSVFDTKAYVDALADATIDTLSSYGLEGIKLGSGVFIKTKKGLGKIASIGAKITKGRTSHGFCLNVNTDLSLYRHIIACGSNEYPATSMKELLQKEIDIKEVSRRVAKMLTKTLNFDRLDDTFTSSANNKVNKPVPAQVTRLKNRVKVTGEYARTVATVRKLGLVTVCEEAACPNIYECWGKSTATFMVNGDACTRACGFCAVKTGRGGGRNYQDSLEAQRVSKAVSELALDYSVITTVARDDLPDGGAGTVRDTIIAIKQKTPNTLVEVLISDLKGDPEQLNLIYEAKPDVLNHNIETVRRLTKSVRPSGRYARSLAVLARAAGYGLVVKSGIMVGLGETISEVTETLTDLAAVGVDIVTIGQYLQPSSKQLPVFKYYNEQEFLELEQVAGELGFKAVQASAMTRSSYKAAELFYKTQNKVSADREMMITKRQYALTAVGLG